MIELDGSEGEGGGQILRTSLALALLTKQSFHLRNVRARRPQPGLRPQHLMSVRAAATVGQAQTRGASLGSSDLIFEPGLVTPGKYSFDIGTAGATALVLHTLYLPLAWRVQAPSEITLKGGTHVKASPCFHFLEATWRPYQMLLGLKIGLNLFRPGFYPRGGGVMEAHVQPCLRLHGLQLPKVTQATQVTAVSAAASLRRDDISRRQARRAAYRLRELGLSVTMNEENWEGGPGTVVMATLYTSPVPTLFCALGERGKPAERVADELVDQVAKHLRAGPGVDLHSADQLVLPMALADGPSEFPVTEVTTHLLTNLNVIRRFVDRQLSCEGQIGGAGKVLIR